MVLIWILPRLLAPDGRFLGAEVVPGRHKGRITGFFGFRRFLCPAVDDTRVMPDPRSSFLIHLAASCREVGSRISYSLSSQWPLLVNKALCEFA